MWPIWCATRFITNPAQSSTSIAISWWNKEGGPFDWCHLSCHIQWYLHFRRKMKNLGWSLQVSGKAAQIDINFSIARRTSQKTSPYKVSYSDIHIHIETARRGGFKSSYKRIKNLPNKQSQLNKDGLLLQRVEYQPGMFLHFSNAGRRICTSHQKTDKHSMLHNIILLHCNDLLFNIYIYGNLSN